MLLPLTLVVVQMLLNIGPLDPSLPLLGTEETLARQIVCAAPRINAIFWPFGPYKHYCLALRAS